MFDKMERRLNEGRTPEDDIFYYHPSEERIEHMLPQLNKMVEDEVRGMASIELALPTLSCLGITIMQACCSALGFHRVDV